MKIKETPLVEINRDAIRVLYKELGPVNAIRFLNQFTNGKRNYTEERDRLFAGLTLKEIVGEIKQRRNK